jgi:type IV secretion system protein VirD4
MGVLSDRPLPKPPKKAEAGQEKSFEERARLLSGAGVPLGYKLHEKGKLHYNHDRHLVTFGPIGSGKNSTSQTPALLEDDASALVIDVKGQLCAITARRRVEMGHEVAVINPFNVLGIPTSAYNPLAHLDPESLSFASDCDRIAEGLVDQRKADHWELSALDVVSLLIMYVRLFEPYPSLVRVRELLNRPEESEKDKDGEITKEGRVDFFKRLAALDPSVTPYPLLVRVLAEGAARYAYTSKEVRDSIQTAVVQVRFLRDPAIAEVLSGEKEISFADLKRRKMTIFIIIPPELLHTHGKFLRLLALSALGELIREPTKPEKPVLFMLDEFAQLGPMALIENAASIVRDYKIRLWIILQNLPQLKNLYKDNWESFLSSAGVVQVFAPNDLETAKYFSERSGVELRFRRSKSSSGDGKSSQNETETWEPLKRPDQLCEMPESEHYLLCAGLPCAFMARRSVYWEKDGPYKGLYDDDPYHMNTKEHDAFKRKAQAGKWVVK